MIESSWRDVFVGRIRKSPEKIIILKTSQNFLEDTLLSEMIESEATLCKCCDSVEMFKCIHENKKSKIILQVTPNTNIPYFVQTSAGEVEFAVEHIFPTLNKSIINDCGVETFDAIFEYCRTAKSGYSQLTKRQTEELLTEALFSLDLNRLTIESSLVVFLTINRKNYRLPAEFLEDIRQGADSDAHARGITFLRKMPTEEELVFWLSEQWQLFLAGSDQAKIDFTDPVIATFLPMLFLSGALHRHKIHDLGQLRSFVKRFSACPWLMTALDFSFFDKQAMSSVLKTRIGILKQIVADVLEKPTAEKWLEIAQQWGQIRYLEYKSAAVADSEIPMLSHEIEKAFREYIFESYDQILIGSTSSNPLSVDKILPNIAAQNNNQHKVALLLFDGMGLDQWEILKAYFASSALKVKTERFAYTMLPSLTGYSRQAIFSAKTPNDFTKFSGISNEKAFFTEFWMTKSVELQDIVYLHLIPDPKVLSKPNGAMSEFLAAISEGKRIIGVIFAFIDKRLHESVDLDVGKKLLYSKIEDFLSSSCLSEIIKILLKKGYRVLLTSDHGNVMAIGNGVVDSKHLVEINGKRCLVYDSIILAEERQKEADVILFASRFVPENQHIIFPNGNFFFGPNGTKEITHGGVSIEEVIVPYVEVEL